MDMPVWTNVQKDNYFLFIRGSFHGPENRSPQLFPRTRRTRKGVGMLGGGLGGKKAEGILSVVVFFFFF